MQINLVRVEYSELKDKEPGECSAKIRARVIKARKIQQERLAGRHLYCNAQMSRREVESFCKLDERATSLMESYFATLHLSARSHDRILKVARTIADLDESAIIQGKHIAEAIQLRTSVSS